MNTMMKNFCKHINRTGMVLLLVLSSCSGEDGLPSFPVGEEVERVPLRLTGATAGNSGGLGIETRAAGDAGRTELTTGSSIGIFLKGDPDKGYAALNNLQFDYATPFWQTKEQILLSKEKAVLAAYYPYVAVKTNPVLLRSQKYVADEDLHYVNFEANKENSALTLNLSRVYACLAFSFKGDTSYSGDGKVTDIRIEGDGIIPVAMLDMLDLAVQNINGSVRNILDPFTGLNTVSIGELAIQFSTTKTDKLECLMIPYQLKGDIDFSVMIDGSKMKGKVSATALCGASGILMEGVKYELNLNVKASRLEVVSISKTEWEPTDVGGDYVIQ